MDFLNKPFFSIIIPTLNEEKFLPRLLDNLTKQTFKNFEVIVVDANSKDKTQQVALKYKQSLHLDLIISKTTHVSYQRNLGAKHAKANIFIFLDADTQIPPNYFVEIKRILKTKKPHILTSWMDPETKSREDKLLTAGMNILLEIGKFLKIPSAYGAMIVVRKKVFKDLGRFNEKTNWAEDTRLAQKAVKHNYKYYLAKHPRYIFSLRRFKKEGTVKALRKYAQLGLALMMEGYESPRIKYPMGGHLFDPSQPNKRSFIWMQKSLNKIKIAANINKKKSLKLKRFLDKLKEEVEILRLPE